MNYNSHSINIIVNCFVTFFNFPLYGGNKFSFSALWRNTVSCTDVLVLPMQRMLLAAVGFVNFSGMKKKEISTIYVYISDIYRL